MQVERILNNDLGILMGRTNSGKTHTLCSIIREYKRGFNGAVTTFGLRDELVKTLSVDSFSSLIELEQIRNSIVIIDEVGSLFDLENRSKRRQIENTLRLVNHRNNKILLSGLPSDFKKFLCAKARVFLFKSLVVSEMINGSFAKEILMQYRGPELGTHALVLDPDTALCYDGQFWKERVGYNEAYDTKRTNQNLFERKNVQKNVMKNVQKM